MLTPVSFRKGRETAPRLTPHRVPGRQSPRFWREDEIEVVRQEYERHGPIACLARLPGRTVGGVYNQASKLGLSAPGERLPRHYVGDTLDAAIKERWPTLQGRGAVGALAHELGVRRHVVSRRALVLGLTMPSRKEPRWTAAEEALLRQAPINDPKAASKFFAAHGFSRSPSSIAIRCKRLRLSRRRSDVFSAHGAARILGVDSKVVTAWCSEGRLPATRRGTQRLPQQGGDTWSIKPTDLRRFVIDELDCIDIRRVDKHAFVELLLTAKGAAIDGQDRGAAP